MLDLGSRPSSDVAQQTCRQLRPRSSRWLTSCGFSFTPASAAFQSKLIHGGILDYSMEDLDRMLAVNVRGVVVAIQAAAAHRARRLNDWFLHDYKSLGYFAKYAWRNSSITGGGVP